MEKLLSVSVAAYNLETMIGQCLDSFLREDILERVEVLVTDDGSKDQTAEIAAGYEKRYPGTFHLIRQKNAGPGSTVNSGIRHASGKYFRMVDGDDWVNTEEMGAYLDYLEKHDTDMVCTSYCCVDHETGEKRPMLLKSDRMDQELPFDQVCEDLHLEMHNVTYRTQILKEHSIVLDNCFYTDAEYLLLPTAYIKTVAFLSRTIYMYRVSLSTQSMNIKSLQKNVQMHRKVLDRLIREYELYRMSSCQSAQKDLYYQKRIAAMAGTQLSIYLSFEDNRQYKKETRDMVSCLKTEHPDIYRAILGMKTYRLLTVSRFALYGPIAYLHKKKLKLN